MLEHFAINITIDKNFKLLFFYKKKKGNVRKHERDNIFLKNSY